MVGRLDATGEISDNGKTLHVHGPLEFEDDESGAELHVTVTQGQSQVSRTSGFIAAPATTWPVTLTGQDTFVPGPAHAEMTATVHLKKGGTEGYPYEGDPPCEREITLIPA